MYLSRFTLPGQPARDALLSGFLEKTKRTCYQNFYPFRVFDNWEEETFSFAPITILYGGNGSGKSTLLNLIGDKLGLERSSVYNSSHFFQMMTDLCGCDAGPETIPPGSRVITSDDVFDYLLDLRNLSQGIDRSREELLQEYRTRHSSKFQFASLDDYEELRKATYAKGKRGSGSGLVRRELGEDLRGASNGESALAYFTEKIDEGCLYLLDEPENSLSASRQQELARFLQDSARFFRCQFIMATHAPFLLAMDGAVVYDLDARPIQPKPWTQLEAVRSYFDFFMAHRAVLEATPS